jgi:hypothetical protein
MAKDFRPLALKAVRDRMVQNGWARRYINSCVGCVTRAFKWAAGQELIPTTVHHGLRTVDGLKKGRTTAPESRANSAGF